MSEERLNEIQTASIFIISGLFLCLTWRFIPRELMYTFPFIDITFPLQDFITLFTESITGIYLLPSALIAGNMSFPVKVPKIKSFKGFSFTYNIWIGVIIFELLKQFDLILFYRQTPFRVTAIVILVSIQLYYLHYSTSINNK